MTPLYDADDDRHDGPLTGPQPLRELIIAQSMQETGIFVLLFTSDTAAAIGESTGENDAAKTVSSKAAELGVDASTLTLFSDEAYLLQAALGETFVPDTNDASLREDR